MIERFGLEGTFRGHVAQPPYDGNRRTADDKRQLHQDKNTFGELLGMGG